MSLRKTLRQTFVFPLQACLVAVGAASAACAGEPLVDSRLTVALIRNDGQSEVAAAATAAKPGDVLEYAVRYANRGNAPAEALAPTMPIPIGTEYLQTDASPRPTHASLDGLSFSVIPLTRPLRGADGVVRIVEVPAAEYRVLRWTVGTLAAGSEVVVRARVRVGRPG